MSSEFSLRFFSYRYLGLFPIFFFLLKVYQYRAPADQGQILWWCTVSNLLLGISMVFRNPRFIWMFSLMLIVGTPTWILDIVATGDFSFYSVLTHLVSPVLGLLSLRTLPGVRGIWWSALIYYVLLMIVSRYLTPPALNVNLAHDVYVAVRPFFSNYWVYTALNTLLLAVSLYVLERILGRVFCLPESDTR